LIVKRVSIVVVVVVVPLGAEPTVTELLFGTAISTPAGVTTSMKKDLVAVFFLSPPSADEKKRANSPIVHVRSVLMAPPTHTKKNATTTEKEKEKTRINGDMTWIIHQK
jgi:hypothetical protein